MAFKNVIDPADARRSLTQWLATQVPEADGVRVSDVTVPQASGLSCETVLFDAAWREGRTQRHKRLVARVAPHPEQRSLSLFPRYDLELEATIMRALRRHTEVPAPGVLFSEPDPSVLGGPFLVMDRVDGRVPPDDPPYTRSGWVVELDLVNQRKLVGNTVGVLGALHAADWKALGLQTLDRRERGEPGVSQYLSTAEHLYADGAGGRSHPTLEAAFAWAERHRPEREGPAVLNWGDARIGNILFAEDLSVAAVLDWEMACLAPREVDLGYFLGNLDFFTGGYGEPSPPGFPSEAEIVEQYTALTGHEVQDLEYHKALAMLMTAVILMRVGYVMIAAEQLPPDSPFPHANPASILLARYMDLPAPTGHAIDWTAAR